MNMSPLDLLTEGLDRVASLTDAGRLTEARTLLQSMRQMGASSDDVIRMVGRSRIARLALTV